MTHGNDYPLMTEELNAATGRLSVTEDAVDAAMACIERLGAGGSRTTVRIVLEYAAPYIIAGYERMGASAWIQGELP